MDKNPLIYGWLVPILQAMTIGALSGLAAWTILAIKGYDTRLALLVVAIAGFMSWMTYKRRWESILAAFHGVIIDYPQQEPTHAAIATLWVELIQDGGLKGDYIDLPLDHYQQVAVAQLLHNGTQLSHASLSGPGKPLSRSEYETLRTVLLQRGLARWINPRAHGVGVELKAAGRALFRHIENANRPTPYNPRRNNHV